MLRPALVPDPEALALDHIEPGDDEIVLVVRTKALTAPCPDCGHAATRVHSRYRRHLADLPWQGLAVRLRLSTRRWFCDSPTCPRRIFTERLPGVAAPHGRRTHRLATLVEAVGFALGGRPGARLLADIGPVLSRDTLLRVIRAAPEPSPPTPRVLGVDDWAIHKGLTYGTILIDLERHRPVDLLPDRTAETFAAWLQTHDGVEVIARDRGGAYADGARQGAPAAIQVADRWHLAKNLGEALERLLDRHHDALRAADLATAATNAPPPDPPPPSPAPVRSPTRAECAKQHRCARREARDREIRALAAQGHGVRAIARTLGVGRRTVRRTLRAAPGPRVSSYTPRLSSLTPYEAYLRERWDAGCQNTAQLWRELRAQGFPGSPSTVRHRLARWRPGPGRSGKPPRTAVTAPAARPAPPVTPPRRQSPRQVAWLLRRADDDLSPAQHTYLEHLTQCWPEAATVRALAHDFARLVRERDGPALGSWLARAEASGLPEFAALAASLRRDAAAVEAALTLEWSNGQTEGQVTRLKLLKRSMYGRAKGDLLRRRVLRAA
jgi:transposase